MLNGCRPNGEDIQGALAETHAVVVEAAAWGRSSTWRPGMRYSHDTRTMRFSVVNNQFRLVDEPPVQILVGIDPAIAQEGPDASHIFAAAHVDLT